MFLLSKNATETNKKKLTGCSRYNVFLWWWCNRMLPLAIAFFTLLRGKTRKAIHSSNKDLMNQTEK